MSVGRRRWRGVARVVVLVVVLSLLAQGVFVVWAALFSGGSDHFRHSGRLVVRQMVWPDVGEVVRPPWSHFDRGHPQWWVVEARVEHPMAFLRFGYAETSSMFGTIPVPKPGPNYIGPDEIQIPPPGQRVERPSAWMGLWETPAEYWAEFPSVDGAVSYVGIGWPMPAFIVRELPPHTRAGSFGSYDFTDRVRPRTIRGPAPARRLPNGVYWSGLGVNVLAWLPVGVVLCVWLVGCVRLVRRGRRWWRLKHGVCWRCRYSLAGLAADAAGCVVCPECGASGRVPARLWGRLRLSRWRVWLRWGLPGVLGSLAGVVSVVVLMVVFVYVFLFLYMWLGIPGANPF